MPDQPDEPITNTATDRHRDVRISIRGSATLTSPYLVMNALAAIIASYGLVQNSVAVVIGAMVIAMLLGPITGIALALVDGDPKLLRGSLIAEVTGAVMVFVIGFVIGKVHSNIGMGTQIMSRTAPNILDLVIAIAGGLAGAYANLSPRLSVGLVGVAIATALVPPLCASGICAAHGLYAASGGAFLLFFTNLVAIQCATSLMLWLHGYHHLSHLDRNAIVRRFAPSVVLLLALVGFLGYSFSKAVAKEALRSETEDILRKQIERNGAAHLADLDILTYGRRTTIVALVRAPWVITPHSCARLEAALRKACGRQDLDLQIRSVLTRQCDAHGFLWEEQAAGGDTTATTDIPPTGSVVAPSGLDGQTSQ